VNQRVYGQLSHTPGCIVTEPIRDHGVCELVDVDGDEKDNDHLDRPREIDGTKEGQGEAS
jgi:hypothetical protein